MNIPFLPNLHYSMLREMFKNQPNGEFHPKKSKVKQNKRKNKKKSAH